MFTLSTIVSLLAVIFIVVTILKTITIVPQQNEYIIERLGKFSRVLTPGLHFLIPFLDVRRESISLQETMIDTPQQSVITKDNVAILIDGLLFYKVMDSQSATYGVNAFRNNVENLGAAALRSAAGSYSLDELNESREKINAKVVEAMDESTRQWGIKVLRFEIRDIRPPEQILRAMEQQVTAERERRAVILSSEGKRQETINYAEGKAKEVTLSASAAAEAVKIQAQAEAEAIRIRAQAQAEALKLIGEQVNTPEGEKAANIDLAKLAIHEYAHMASKGSTIIVPDDMSGVASLLVQGKSFLK